MCCAMPYHDAMQATSSGDDENDSGIGGGVFNREGMVRFKGNATFIGNYAQVSINLTMRAN